MPKKWFSFCTLDIDASVPFSKPRIQQAEGRKEWIIEKLLNIEYG